MKPFPFYFQSTHSDCGPTCLKMVADFHGKNFNVRDVKNWSKILTDGSSMLDIMDAAESLGFTCTGLKIEVEQLEYINHPVILHWDKQHFVALFKIQNGIYYVADPSTGIIKLISLTY